MKLNKQYLYKQQSTGFLFRGLFKIWFNDWYPYQKELLFCPTDDEGKIIPGVAFASTSFDFWSDYA